MASTKSQMLSKSIKSLNFNSFSEMVIMCLFTENEPVTTRGILENLKAYELDISMTKILKTIYRLATATNLKYIIETNKKIQEDNGRIINTYVIKKEFKALPFEDIYTLSKSNDKIGIQLFLMKHPNFKNFFDDDNIKTKKEQIIIDYENTNKYKILHLLLSKAQSGNNKPQTTYEISNELNLPLQPVSSTCNYISNKTNLKYVITKEVIKMPIGHKQFPTSSLKIKEEFKDVPIEDLVPLSKGLCKEKIKDFILKYPDLASFFKEVVELKEIPSGKKHGKIGLDKDLLYNEKIREKKEELSNNHIVDDLYFSKEEEKINDKKIKYEPQLRTARLKEDIVDDEQIDTSKIKINDADKSTSKKNGFDFKKLIEMLSNIEGKNIIINIETININQANKERK